MTCTKMPLFTTTQVQHHFSGEKYRPEQKWLRDWNGRLRLAFRFAVSSLDCWAQRIDFGMRSYKHGHCRRGRKKKRDFLSVGRLKPSCTAETYWTWQVNFDPRKAYPKKTLKCEFHMETISCLKAGRSGWNIFQSEGAFVLSVKAVLFISCHWELVITTAQ